MGNLYVALLGFSVGIWLLKAKKVGLGLLNLALSLLNVWCWLWEDRE